MKMFLISDNVDTLTGMRLAGIEGVLVHTEKELEAALKAAVADPENGIVLLTEKFGREYPDLVDRVKETTAMPLILDIPDRHGSGRSGHFITDYISRTIGLQL